MPESPTEPEEVKNSGDDQAVQAWHAGEDVLASPPGTPPEDRPAFVKARPSPWSRGRDRLIVAGIVAAVVISGGVIWLNSDSRATVSETAAAAAELPGAPEAVPGSLRELWQVKSGATPVPVAEGTGVVTGDGGEVLGRDAITGEVRWRYARDLALCTVSGVWSKAVAVYRKDTGCSEVTQLDPGTGERTAQRNGDAELGTRLVDDGSHVTTTGKKLLNTWRDDLVKSMEYGQVPAIVNANKQPRTGCEFGSVAAGSGKVGVIERCPGDTADRLSVYRATAKESDEPDEVFSVLTAGRGARVIAMSGQSTAIALPEQRLLVIYDGEGAQRTAYPLDLPAADLAGDPAGGAVTTARGNQGIFWFTGSKTMALSRTDLAPQWTVNGTLGAGTVFAGQLVLPIPGGLAVVAENSGQTSRTLGVDRHGYTGPVALNSIGPVLLEQRGETLTALR